MNHISVVECEHFFQFWEPNRDLTHNIFQQLSIQVQGYTSDCRLKWRTKRIYIYDMWINYAIELSCWSAPFVFAFRPKKKVQRYVGFRGVVCENIDRKSAFGILLCLSVAMTLPGVTSMDGYGMMEQNTWVQRKKKQIFSVLRSINRVSVKGISCSNRWFSWMFNIYKRIIINIIQWGPWLQFSIPIWLPSCVCMRRSVFGPQKKVFENRCQGSEICWLNFS